MSYRPHRFLVLVLCAVFSTPVFSGVVTIEHHQDGFRLLRDNKPLLLQGAVVDDATALPNAPARPVSERLRQLKSAGANAARLAAKADGLQMAESLGLAAVVDLVLEGERDGLDWDNEAQVEAQNQRILAQVKMLKDAPAVTLWLLGNELDYIPPDEPFNPRVWQRLNSLALRIKEIDPNHPILTIVGFSRFEEKVQTLAKVGSAFDLLGLNAYGQLEPAIEILKKHWPKPFILTEWGPTGHWEVPTTIWEAPIEQTSQEKAESIRHRYYSIIAPAAPFCVGSFVFFWSEKQETTHTWYGLFKDGKYTPSIDVLHEIWTGKPPSNRAPVIKAFTLEGTQDKTKLVLQPKTSSHASIDVVDPEGDKLSYSWDVRPEVQIPDDNYAGRKEKRAPVFEEAIEENQGDRVRIRIPDTPGAYRLFVTVSDGKGSVAYANFPFLVEGNSPSQTKMRRHL